MDNAPEADGRIGHLKFEVAVGVDMPQNQGASACLAAGDEERRPVAPAGPDLPEELTGSVAGGEPDRVDVLLPHRRRLD